MRRVLVLAAALVAAGALGALAAGSLAGGDDPRTLTFAADREFERVAVESVAGSPIGSSGPLRAARGQKLAFFQTPEPLEIAAATEEGATLSCPKGFEALEGYFFSGRPGTFLGLTSPEVGLPEEQDPQTGDIRKPSKRNWTIAVFNATSEADQVVFGVGCLNKVK